MTDHDPVETAWKIHATLVDWTGKVDTKASFAATIESVVLGGAITLSGENRLLSEITGFPAFLRNTSLVLLALAAISAISVVTPRLRSFSMTAEASENFIYFGHLKHWQPDDLATALTHRESLPVLSRQLVVMSKVAWQKHRRVQISLWLAVLAVAIFGLASWMG